MTKFIATRAAARVALIEKLQELWTARAQGIPAGEKKRPLLFALDLSLIHIDAADDPYV